jgi:hypothetical protein
LAWKEEITHLTHSYSIYEPKNIGELLSLL